MYSKKVLIDHSINQSVSQVAFPAAPAPATPAAPAATAEAAAFRIGAAVVRRQMMTKAAAAHKVAPRAM